MLNAYVSCFSYTAFESYDMLVFVSVRHKNK